MAIYTGVADANGDFTVPFSSNYTGGQKVTVTAEKDSATKTIELFAPSDVIGGGVIQIDGTYDNFPLNIGNITLSSEITGVIQAFAFRPHTDTQSRSMFIYAKGLTILGDVVGINTYAFYGWTSATFLNLPESLTTLGTYAFQGWVAALSLDLPINVLTIPNYCFYGWTSALKLEIHSGVTSIGSSAFYNWTSCNEVICRALTPPSIAANTFQNIKSTCIFKVPAESVATYQGATNWSAFASRIQAI